MRKANRNVWQVGLFFNIGLALVLIVLFSFGGPTYFFSRKLHYHFNELSAQGLSSGAKVLVAGVNAGTVSSIHVDSGSATVRVDIAIEPKFISSIRGDSYATLATQGVLGDKVVMVQAGSPTQPELKDNSELAARPTVSMDRLMAEGDVFLQHLDQLTLVISQWVGGLGSKERSKQIAMDAAQTMRNLAQITERIKHLDFDQLNESLKKSSSILGKIDHGNGAIGGLINDPQLYDDVKKLIGESNENRIIRNLVRQSINDAEKKKAG